MLGSEFLINPDDWIISLKNKIDIDIIYSFYVVNSNTNQV